MLPLLSHSHCNTTVLFGRNEQKEFVKENFNETTQKKKKLLPKENQIEQIINPEPRKGEKKKKIQDYAWWRRSFKKQVKFRNVINL